MSAQLDQVDQAIETFTGLLINVIERLDVLIGLATEEYEPLVPFMGQQRVKVTGTAVMLGVQPCQAVVVQALAGNAHNVIVGNAGISQTVGFELQVGQAVGIATDSMSQLWVNGTANDGVCWIGT